MAVYKSQFKGSQIDNAVSVANANINKGSNDTPIYYDNEGLAQPIEKDTTATVSSVKPLTSGGAYTGLEAVVDNSDIQYENFNGEFTKVGNPTIVDGIASGFSSSNYLYTQNITLSGDFEVKFVGYLTSITGKYVIGTGTTSTSARKNLSLELWDGIAHVLFGNGTNNQDVYKNQTNLVANTINYINFGRKGNKYFVESSQDNINFKRQEADVTYEVNGTFTLYFGAIGTFDGNIDLNQFSITVNGKPVYTPYPQPTLPPSQNAVKQYVDNSLPAKQDTLYGGYGINVNGATVSVSDDVFREDEEAKLHADLKVDHFGDMSVGNDSEVLELMNEAKHSTFDASKFTVVGSPIVTEDGIASGFSTSKYLTVPKLGSFNTFKIKTKFKVTSQTGATQAFLTNGGLPYGLAVCILNNRRLIIYLSSDGVNRDIADGTSSSNTLTVGVDYYLLISFDGTKYTFDISTDDRNYANWITINSTSKVYGQNLIYLGYVGTFFSATGIEFDLKQFSITIDGVPVFSGNKTGIDIIKPDDYTVVGTPTISADGIASGFSSDNYISFYSNSVQDSTDWELDFQYNTGAFSSFCYVLSGDNSSHVRCFYVGCSLITSSFNISFNYIDGAWEVSLSSENWGSLTANTNYWIKVIYKSGTYYFYISLDGKTYTLADSQQGNALNNIDSFLIGKLNTSSSSIAQGTFDLNAVKLFIDGNLVYQPCLKIPYTLTKDGKKIVGSNYRFRIEDEYAQAGFTPYYTLSDTDYTMATVEEDDIVASLEGATSYTQRADLSIEQQGTTTNGTTVTFPKAFIDTNYALSIPYSAKTKTGFTAAADGDYIAEGNVSI